MLDPEYGIAWDAALDVEDYATNEGDEEDARVPQSSTRAGGRGRESRQSIGSSTATVPRAMVCGLPLTVASISHR